MFAEYTFICAGIFGGSHILSPPKHLLLVTKQGLINQMLAHKHTGAGGSERVKVLFVLDLLSGLLGAHTDDTFCPYLNMNFTLQ